MKVYSQKQVNSIVDSAVARIVNKLHDECIQSVEDHLNNIVLRRDNTELLKLEQRITILELEPVATFKSIPKPRYSKARSKMIQKLDDLIK